MVQLSLSLLNGLAVAAPVCSASMLICLPRVSWIRISNDSQQKDLELIP